MASKGCLSQAGVGHFLQYTLSLTVYRSYAMASQAHFFTETQFLSVAERLRLTACKCFLAAQQHPDGIRVTHALRLMGGMNR
jgi:hypothetical protein